MECSQDKITRPTEFETEYVDMAVSVPIRELTLQEIESATEVDADLSCISWYYSNKAAQIEGRTYPPSCRSILPSRKSYQFSMVLCSTVSAL